MVSKTNPDNFESTTFPQEERSATENITQDESTLSDVVFNDLVSAPPSSFSPEISPEEDSGDMYTTTEDSDLATLGDLMYKLLTNPHVINMTHTLDTSLPPKPSAIRTKPIPLKLSEEKSRIVTVVPVSSLPQNPRTSIPPTKSPSEYREYHVPQGKLGIVKFSPFNFNVTVDSNISRNHLASGNWSQQSKLSQKESNIFTVTPVYINMTPTNVSETRLSMLEENEGEESKLCNKKNKFLSFHPVDIGTKSAPQSNNIKISPHRNIPYDYLKRNSSKKLNFSKRTISATDGSSTVNIKEELKLLSMMCQLLTASPPSEFDPNRLEATRTQVKPNTKTTNKDGTTETMSSSTSTRGGEKAPPPEGETKSAQISECVSKEIRGEDITGSTSVQDDDCISNSPTTEVITSTMEHTGSASTHKPALKAPKPSDFSLDTSSQAISKTVLRKGKGDISISRKLGNTNTNRSTVHQSIFRSMAKSMHETSTYFTSGFARTTTPQGESPWVSSPEVHIGKPFEKIHKTTPPENEDKSKIPSPVMPTDPKLINWMCKLVPNASFCETTTGSGTETTASKILENEERTQLNSLRTTHAFRISRKFNQTKYQQAINQMANISDQEIQDALSLTQNFTPTICTQNDTSDLRLIYLMCDVVPTSTGLNNINSHVENSGNNILETSTLQSDSVEAIVETPSPSSADDADTSVWYTSRNIHLTDETNHGDTKYESMRKNFNEDLGANEAVSSKKKRMRRRKDEGSRLLSRRRRQ